MRGSFRPSAGRLVATIHAAPERHLGIPSGEEKYENRADCAAHGDSMIRKKVMMGFKSERWSKHALLSATVEDGTVKSWGIVDFEAEKEATRVLRNRSRAFARSRTT